MTSQLWWYAARAGGFVAWGLLSASVIWGLLLSNKLRPGKVRPNWILDLHRFLGGLAVVFTAVHVLTIMADSYTSFGPTDVLVPFVSSWKPLATAWGIVSLYVLLAVELTSLVKRHLPTRLWRRIHVLSLPLFATATIHLLTAGTDAGNRVVTWLVAAVSAIVVALTAWRLSHLRTTRAPRIPYGAAEASSARCRARAAGRPFGARWLLRAGSAVRVWCAGGTAARRSVRRRSP